MSTHVPTALEALTNLLQILLSAPAKTQVFRPIFLCFFFLYRRTFDDRQI